jgi:hypothetical protein
MNTDKETKEVMGVNRRSSAAQICFFKFPPARGCRPARRMPGTCGAAIPGCRAEIRLGLPRHPEKPKTRTKMHNAVPPPHANNEIKEVTGVHRRLNFVFSNFPWPAPADPALW